MIFSYFLVYSLALVSEECLEQFSLYCDFCLVSSSLAHCFAEKPVSTRRYSFYILINCRVEAFGIVVRVPKSVETVRQLMFYRSKRKKRAKIFFRVQNIRGSPCDKTAKAQCTVVFVNEINFQGVKVSVHDFCVKFS